MRRLKTLHASKNSDNTAFLYLYVISDNSTTNTLLPFVFFFLPKPFKLFTITFFSSVNNFFIFSYTWSLLFW